MAPLSQVPVRVKALEARLPVDSLDLPRRGSCSDDAIEVTRDGVGEAPLAGWGSGRYGEASAISASFVGTKGDSV